MLRSVSLRCRYDLNGEITHIALALSASPNVASSIAIVASSIAIVAADVMWQQFSLINEDSASWSLAMYVGTSIITASSCTIKLDH